MRPRNIIHFANKQFEVQFLGNSSPARMDSPSIHPDSSLSCGRMNSPSKDETNYRVIRYLKVQDSDFSAIICSFNNNFMGLYFCLLIDGTIRYQLIDRVLLTENYSIDDYDENYIHSLITNPDLSIQNEWSLTERKIYSSKLNEKIVLAVNALNRLEDLLKCTIAIGKDDKWPKQLELEFKGYKIHDVEYYCNKEGDRLMKIFHLENDEFLITIPSLKGMLFRYGASELKDLFTDFEFIIASFIVDYI